MAGLLPRPLLQARLERAIREAPVTLLLGPRQCGKTTLARGVASRRTSTWYDLEDPLTPLRPEAAALLLGRARGLVVIDEFQHQPGLFELLRVLSDRRPLPARFLILGSASPALVRGASESLAGRVARVEMGGFHVPEVPPAKIEVLWARGGLPASFLAPSDERSFRWRIDFMQSFVERDVPALGIRVPSAALRRFWTMLAHLHGRTWNAAELARAMGTKDDTARSYLDVLAGAFMIRQLPPFFVNVGKRLVKAPKIYLRDTGLLHALLGLRGARDVFSHPVLGFSWEGFALEQVIRLADAEHDAFFYRTHSGAELDLVIARGRHRAGFEFKLADRPEVTRSMHVALEDLGLRHLWVVYPGKESYPLSKKITVLPLARLPDAIAKL